ncbi:MAG: nuclear transport factor 2 family protein [Chloroflexota bacterium]
MTFTYAAAHDLLDGLVRARSRYDGDAYTACFADGAEVSLDPFDAPLAGHNALRAYLEAAAGSERWFDMAIERHWVSGETILAAWHSSWNRPSDEAKVRQAGFLSAEVGEDGRIVRLKHWTTTREHLAADGRSA